MAQWRVGREDAEATSRMDNSVNNDEFHRTFFCTAAISLILSAAASWMIVSRKLLSIAPVDALNLSVNSAILALSSDWNLTNITVTVLNRTYRTTVR